MKKYTLLLAVLFMCGFALQAQDEQTDDKKDKKEKKEKEQKIKTRWNFGVLPVVAYDADMGFQYGVLANIFHFGDGSTYPEYRHSFKFEISRFTKGSGINQIFYDSKYLIKGLRVTADLSYLTDRALDFYGFNGYQAAYHPEFEDQTSDQYKSRMFYRHDRKRLRTFVDFQGRLFHDNFKWIAGLAYLDVQAGTVDIDHLNKGKSEEDKLPDIPLLYDLYREYGLIKADEAEGGKNFFLKAGVIFDTRDFEPSPSKGIWAEAVVSSAPDMFGNDHPHTKLALTWRQYFPISKKKLVFAYRLSYQGTLAGNTPFYMQPYMITSFSSATKNDGLGGAKNIRGVLRNRVVGDGIAYGNLELRWRLYRTVLWNQNIYIALHGFLDGGQVVKEVELDKAGMPHTFAADPDYFDQDKDSMHLGTGLGARFVLNENFILAIDYGFALDKRDGLRGLYISINNLF